jgi:hypothetical protein
MLFFVAATILRLTGLIFVIATEMLFNHQGNLPLNGRFFNFEERRKRASF